MRTFNTSITGNTKIVGLFLPRPILQRFGQMGRLDLIVAGQIGDGAGYFEHEVEGGSTEVHLRLVD